jgi:hypothetical protein
MDALLVTMIFLGLIVWGLERNQRRQQLTPPPLAGSSPVVDRDTERLLDDLRARQ